jgi:LysM repeat protein
MFAARRAIALILIAALLLLALPGTIHADGYVVQPGDTLSGIAERFGTTQAALLAANPHITSPDVLWAGAELTIPDDSGEAEAATTPPPAADSSTPPAARGGVRLTHLVQPGDTLSEIAETYETTTAAILALNPGSTADHLIAGAVLIIVDTTGGGEASRTPATTPPTVGELLPASTGQPVATAPRVGDQAVSLYTVAPGDTFSGLADRAGVTQLALSRLNPHVDPQLLYVGQTLFVPIAGDAPSARGAVPTVTTTAPYTVAPGDTATDIADDFGISLSALRDANPGVDLSFVFVGQEIQVPGAPAQRPDAGTSLDPGAELTTYVVRPGDFAGEIADLHGISLDALSQLNPRLDLNFITVGQALVVPLVDLPPPPPGTVGAGPAPQLTYTVQPGDTVSAIALRYDADAAALALLNPGLNPNLISVGESLFVPGTVPIPTVSRTFAPDFGDSIEYVAAAAGVTPHTLLANNPGLTVGYIGPGTALRVPDREGVIVDVRAGDTLQAIAAQFGTTVAALVDAPFNGVVDPNGLIAGQELLIPIITPVFVWPAHGDLTDGFGVCRSWDCSHRHRGVDIAQNGGALVAMADGVVTEVGGSWCCGLGFFVEIDHGDGWVSVYGHLNGPAWVYEGQVLSAGDPIGEVGTTGYSTGVHLHLELYHNEWALDALNYLP